MNPKPPFRLLLLLAIGTVMVLAQRRRPTEAKDAWNYRDGCEHPDYSLLGQRSSSGLISKWEVKNEDATALLREIWPIFHCWRDDEEIWGCHCKRLIILLVRHMLSGATEQLRKSKNMKIMVEREIEKNIWKQNYLQSKSTISLIYYRGNQSK